MDKEVVAQNEKQVIVQSDKILHVPEGLEAAYYHDPALGTAAYQRWPFSPVTKMCLEYSGSAARSNMFEMGK